LLKEALCRSERVADANIHTSRPGVGYTCRATNQTNAGAILVVDTRNPGVHRGALGEVVDIADRILVGLATAAAVALPLNLALAYLTRKLPGPTGMVAPSRSRPPSRRLRRWRFPLLLLYPPLSKKLPKLLEAPSAKSSQVAGCGDGMAKSRLQCRRSCRGPIPTFSGPER
jgi:hypothetical protein